MDQIYIEEHEKIMLHNFTRIEEKGLDFSFFLDNSLERDEFADRLEDFIFSLSEITGEKGLIDIVPHIEKILYNPDIDIEEIRKIINLKIIKQFVSPALKELSLIYSVLKNSMASAKNQEESETYTLLSGAIMNCIKALAYMEQGVEDDDTEKFREALFMLKDSQNKVNRKIKELQERSE